MIANSWLSRILDSAVIIVVGMLLVRMVQHIVNRVEHKNRDQGLAARRTTVYRLLISVIRYTVDFLVIVMVLDQFQVHTTAIVASAGILGLAISFGAQGLVQDVVTGLFLLYEDQFVVGDFITLPNLNLSGTVLEVGIRITRLTGTSGELIIVPNRLILEVQNPSRGQTTISVMVPVPSTEDPERVHAVLQSAVDELSATTPGVRLAGIDSFAAGQVLWQVTAPADYENGATVGKALKTRIAHILYANGMVAGGAKGSTHE